MIKFITDTRAGEPEFDKMVFQNDLLITELDGKPIKTVPAPTDGWTHEILERLAEKLYEEEGHSSMINGADAYLGTQWVGSTEV